MDIIRRPLSYFMPYCSDYCSDYYYNFRGRFNNVSVNYKPNNNTNDALQDMLDMLDINIPEFGPIPSDYILITVKHIDNVMTDDDIKTMHQGWEIIERPDEITDIEINIES
jgi:hypothetical protein